MQGDSPVYPSFFFPKHPSSKVFRLGAASRDLGCQDGAKLSGLCWVTALGLGSQAKLKLLS